MRVFAGSILLCSIVIVFTISVSAQTTEFTYQGSLQNSSAPANGNFDFEFLLYGALSGGTQIGTTLTRTSVAVAGGSFSVKLDFGSQFPGASRFLEIHVRPTGGGSFTPLAPRQSVSSSPYSVQSLNAATATNATQLGGLAASQYVATTDPRMTDARSPTAGSTSYIQNGTSQQASSNFSISGSGFFGGNVGIGTNVATKKLVVGGGAGSSGVLNDGIFVNFPGGGAAITARNSTNGVEVQVNAESSGVGTVGTFSNHPLNFRTNNAEAMRISATGSVGIGTAAPVERLEITGSDATVRVRNTNDAGGGYIQNSFSTLQLGIFNPSATVFGQVPAGGKRSFFGVGYDGRVGSTTNLNNGNPTFRNLLDDGSGNAAITGNLAAKNLPGLEFDVPNISESDVIFDIGPGQTATLKTVTVDVPANGFLVLIGSAYAHPLPSNNDAYGDLQLFDETANTTFATSTFFEIIGHYAAETIHGVLPVSAGSRTISLKLRCSNGSGHHMGYYGNRSSFVVMFFPVRY